MVINSWHGEPILAGVSQLNEVRSLAFERMPPALEAFLHAASN